LLLALAAERALQQVTAVSNTRHGGGVLLSSQSVMKLVVRVAKDLIGCWSRRYPHVPARCDP
jgi:hypothetical protein